MIFCVLFDFDGVIADTERSNRDCLAIGDSPTGGLAAKLAGLQVVGYKGGSAVQDTRETDYFASTFAEIRSYPLFQRHGRTGQEMGQRQRTNGRLR